jgi:putative acetyltransferase
MELRRLGIEEMAAAAQVHRAAFDDRLPWLSGLHTPEQDKAYFRDHVFASCFVWGVFEVDDLVGILAYRDGWVDQLYVLPGFQSRGFGTTLLDVAKSANDRLRLWTFQKNAAARSFYEAKGFVNVKETDGSDNDEGEPDVLYEWRVSQG